MGCRRRRRALAAPAASALKVMVDKSKVDLKAHRLEVKMSRPAGKVKITVYDESNAVLADEEQNFSGRPGGTPLIVTWNPSSDAAGREDRAARLRRAGQLGRRRDRALVRQHPARRRELPDRLGGDRRRRGAQGRGGVRQDRRGPRQGHRLRPDARRHHALHRRPHRHRRQPDAQLQAVAGPRPLDRGVVPQARRQDPDLLRGLRRDVAGGQDRRQHRRGARTAAPTTSSPTAPRHCPPPSAPSWKRIP